MPAPHGDAYTLASALPALEMSALPRPPSDLCAARPSESSHMIHKQRFGSCSELGAYVITVLQDLRANGEEQKKNGNQSAE